MKFQFSRSILLLSAVLSLGAIPRTDAIADESGSTRIMTQNMSLGTNFTEILTASSQLAFVQAVTTTYLAIQATKPAERAAALANEIVKARPDFVALQEAAILRTGTRPATTVVSDQLQLLL